MVNKDTSNGFNPILGAEGDEPPLTSERKAESAFPVAKPEIPPVVIPAPPVFSKPEPVNGSVSTAEPNVENITLPQVGSIPNPNIVPPANPTVPTPNPFSSTNIPVAQEHVSPFETTEDLQERPLNYENLPTEPKRKKTGTLLGAVIGTVAVALIAVPIVNSSNDGSRGMPPTSDGIPAQSNLTKIAEDYGYGERVAQKGSTIQMGENFFMPAEDSDDNPLILDYKVTKVEPVPTEYIQYLDKGSETEGLTVQAVYVEWDVVEGTPIEYSSPYVLLFAYGAPGENVDNTWFDYTLSQSLSPKEQEALDEYCPDPYYSEETLGKVQTSCQIYVSKSGVTGIEFGHWNSDYNPDNGNGVIVSIPPVTDNADKPESQP